MFRPSRVVDTRSSNAHPHRADAQCSPMIPASSSIGIFALSHAAPTWRSNWSESSSRHSSRRAHLISPSMLCALFIGFVLPLVTTPTDILLGDRPARFALHVSHLRAKEQAMARVRSSTKLAWIVARRREPRARGYRPLNPGLP